VGSGHHLLHPESAFMVRHRVGFTQSAGPFIERRKTGRLSRFYVSLKKFHGTGLRAGPIFFAPFLIQMTGSYRSLFAEVVMTTAMEKICMLCAGMLMVNFGSAASAGDDLKTLDTGAAGKSGYDLLKKKKLGGPGG
jgi:hypothetical protein